MSYKLLLTGLLTIVTVAFCAGRGLAQPGEKPASELEAIARQLSELKKSVDELKGTGTATDTKLRRLHRTVGDLKLQMAEMQREIATISKPVVVPPLTEKASAGKEPASTESNYPPMSNEEIKKRIDRLELEMARTRVAGRIANYPSETGRIRLINDLSYETAVIVNGRVYHVPPRDTVFVEGQPAGTFTYQVLGAQPELLTRYVKPNGEFTIRTY